MCNIKFIYLVIFCDPWAFLLGRVALQYPKITIQVKIQELQCAVQSQSAHNKNPTVQHTYKEHNNSIKRVLFKHDCKHQLLFVCGRPLSIIVLFYRPIVPPNLCFSASLSFLMGVRRAFTDLQCLSANVALSCQMCRWPLTEIKLLCAFPLVLVMLLGKNCSIF